MPTQRRNPWCWEEWGITHCSAGVGSHTRHVLYSLTAKSPITRGRATLKGTQREGCHYRHQQASACPRQGQGVRSAAGQAGSAPTLLEDEDAVSRTVALASAAHTTSIKEGWHGRGTRQGSRWMGLPKSPLPSASALPNEGRSSQGLISLAGSHLLCGVSSPLWGLPSIRSCLDKGCRSRGSRALHNPSPSEARHLTNRPSMTAQSTNASGICPLPFLNRCGFFHLHKQGKQSP